MDFAGAELEVSAGLLCEVAAAAGSDVVLLSAFDADEDHPGCSIHVLFQHDSAFPSRIQFWPHMNDTQGDEEYSPSKEGNDFSTGQRKVHVVSPRTGFLSSRHHPDGEKM